LLLQMLLRSLKYCLEYLEGLQGRHLYCLRSVKKESKIASFCLHILNEFFTVAKNTTVRLDGCCCTNNKEWPQFRADPLISTQHYFSLSFMSLLQKYLNNQYVTA
jgi:hypothetical protein